MTAAQPAAHPASAPTLPGFTAVTPDTACHAADVAHRPDAVSARPLPKPRVRLP